MKKTQWGVLALLAPVAAVAALSTSVVAQGVFLLTGIGLFSSINAGAHNFLASVSTGSIFDNSLEGFTGGWLNVADLTSLGIFTTAMIGIYYDLRSHGKR